MNRPHHSTLPWVPPLAFAARYAGGDLTLLYSGLQEQASGRFSYLFLCPVETIEGENWDNLPALSTLDNGLPHWVGYLGYGIRGETPPIASPDFLFTRYAEVIRFDHQKQMVDRFSMATAMPQETPAAARLENKITSIASNFTRAEHETIVAKTLEQIRAGNFYQANITRKFFGEFAQAPDSWRLFTSLCEASPAPYSAYIRHGDFSVLSSSPECFLQVNGHGVITTRPIKGSARRSEDQKTDETIRQSLTHSNKNLAENLMITDLMRNDLARVSMPQTVKVTEQSALYSYATIHHLITTICAQKLPEVSVYEVVRACFPPGSMTGAPKIAAIRWCAAQEKLERGIYSGAIGWFGGGDTCDLSVVIRTLILRGRQFEFQVGGGIVADSIPQEEWQETIVKARGILMALGLTEADIAAL